MKLVLEKNVKITVDLNGENLIPSEDAILFQNVSNSEVFLYIKSEKDGKELKIKIQKNE